MKKGFFGFRSSDAGVPPGKRFISCSELGPDADKAPFYREKIHENYYHNIGPSRVARLFLLLDTKTGKMYQINIKCTKLS
jgi:hypothetical protein